MTLSTEDFRKKLEARLMTLVKRVDTIEDKFAKSGDAPFDGDSGAVRSLSVLRDMDDMAASEARAIHAALDRIQAGDFGDCVTCGEPIDDERLEAVPHTPFCKVHAP
ncbi:MAG: TraR/DksA family transcriptional regulator [Alphaproteobacteria bacterium]